MADISKITLPSGTTYDLKDSIARETITIDLGTINSTTSVTLPTSGGYILESLLKNRGVSRIHFKCELDSRTYYGQIYEGNTLVSGGDTIVVLVGTVITSTTDGTGYSFTITVSATSVNATVSWNPISLTDTTYSAGDGLELNDGVFSAARLGNPVWPSGQNTTTVPVNTAKTVTSIGSYTLPSTGVYIIVRQAIFPSAGVGWRKVFESLSNTGSERGYLWRSQVYYNVNGDEVTAEFTTVETASSDQLTRYLRVVCYSTTTSSYSVGAVKWRVNYFRLY